VDVKQGDVGRRHGQKQRRQRCCVRLNVRAHVARLDSWAQAACEVGLVEGGLESGLGGGGVFQHVKHEHANIVIAKFDVARLCGHANQLRFRNGRNNRPSVCSVRRHSETRVHNSAVCTRSLEVIIDKAVDVESGQGELEHRRGFFGGRKLPRLGTACGGAKTGRGDRV